MVIKKLSGKADQSALASEGSEHAWLFSIAINCSNKMNFSWYANMAQMVTHKYAYVIIKIIKKIMKCAVVMHIILSMMGYFLSIRTNFLERIVTYT